MERKEREKIIKELASLRKIRNRIDVGLEKLKELRFRATRITRCLGDDVSKSTQSCCSSKVENAAIKIMEAADIVAQDVILLENLSMEITIKINQIEDTTSRTLLELRYVFFYEWEKVAATMSYSLFHVMGFLHNKALEEYFLTSKV